MRITTANLDFATGPRQDKKHLALLCEGTDVLCVQEAKNLTLSEELPATGWRSFQALWGEARRGSAICLRNELQHQHRKLHLGVRPWYHGKRVGMLTRYFQTLDVTTEGFTVRVFSAHPPPARFAFLQPKMMERLARAIAESPWPVVVCADWNMPIAEAAARLGLVAHGEGIIGILVDPELHVTTARIDRRGVRAHFTDHPAVTVSVRSRLSATPPRTLGS